MATPIAIGAVLAIGLFAGRAARASSEERVPPNRFVERSGARPLWAAKPAAESPVGASRNGSTRAASNTPANDASPAIVGGDPASWKLNWRRLRPQSWGEQKVGAGRSRQPHVVQAAAVQLERPSPPGELRIRAATELAPSDPLPDRVANQPNSDSTPAPTDAAKPLSLLHTRDAAATTVRDDPPNALFRPPVSAKGGPASAEPLPPPAKGGPASAEPLPAPAKGGPASAEPLPPPAKGGRDCSSDAAECEKERRSLGASPIAKIDLDITPLLVSEPPAADKEQQQDAAKKRERLANQPPRSWKDRDNTAVAEGRLIDYRNGRVHIEKDGGGVVEIPFGQLSNDDLCYVAEMWNLPTECTLGDDGGVQPRQWVASTFTWKASNLCHKPLYFEEVQLERYGHTHGPIRQPLVSTAHFFSNIASLPYQMGIHPPMECRYPLGYYRPGSCAPWLVPPVPLSIRGGLTQAGVVLGGVFALP